jgi:glycosyltransferase involved in cell wall biosynthesis
MRFSILVPTYRRPEPLRRALLSLLAQEGLDGAQDELIVVDNDGAGSAEATVLEIAANAPIPVRYVQEKTPGVAAVRNTAFREAKGEFLCLLDDDQEADKCFLSELHRALETFKGDLAFSAIEAVFEGAIPEPQDAWLRLFARTYPDAEGELRKEHRPGLSTGGVLVRRSAVSAVFGTGAPFDLALGRLGGEDTAFFRAMHGARKISLWVPGAKIREFIPESRATVRFLLERRFGSGQVRTRMHLRGSKLRAPFEVALFMGLGAGQASVAALKWGAAKTRRQSHKETEALAEMAAGLGKLLWPFEIKRYGAKKSKKGT